jgi:protoheme IX farnesyltransferase
MSTLSPSPSIALRARLADYVELTKPGITTMVVLTAATGYWMGLRGEVNHAVLLHVLAGTALASAGACALNMVLEREGDSRMRRTRSRPIPAGRIRPRDGYVFGVTLVLAGTVWLALGVGWPAGALAGVISAGYLFAYTPLKPVSSLSTLVGAQMGAAPPLIGWVAARGSLGLGAWILFAILVFWQWPHILSMAWINRPDLREVHYPLAPVFEGTGRRAARHMLAGTLALVAASLAPYFSGLAGAMYLVPAAALGLGFLALAAAFARDRTTLRARRVFLASLAYLPLLLIALALGKA